MNPEFGFAPREAISQPEEKWNLLPIELPEARENLLSDTLNVIASFNEQFGHPKLDIRYNPLDESYTGLAVFDRTVEGNHVRLGPAAMQAARPLRVRLIAHEVQHAHDLIDFDKEETVNLLNQIDEFQELTQRMLAQYDSLIASNESFVGLRENYAKATEVLARLRAYQIYLTQISNGEETSPAHHEFIEVLRPDDLRWLDSTYITEKTAGLAPITGQKVSVRLNKTKSESTQ